MSYISNVYDILGDSMGDGPQIKGSKKDNKLKEEPKIAQNNNNNNAQSQPASSPKVVDQKAAPEKKVEGKGSSPKIEAKKDDKKPVEAKKASNGSPKPADNKETSSPKETVSSPSIESSGESPVFPERGADFRNDNRSGPRSDKRDSKDKGFKDNKDLNGRGRSNDRKSGTGRSPTENKRAGSGKANWGNAEDEIKESIAVENEHAAGEAANGEHDKSATKDTEAKTDAPATSTTTTSTTAAPPTDKPAEEEDKSITYAEYLRKQKQQVIRLAASETRKAGEGVDAAAWADYQELRKDDPEKRPKKKEGKEKEKEKEEKEKVKKVALDEVFTIKYPSQPDRRDRRGGDRERRGGKTGGGRGDNRDNRDNRFRQGNARKENSNAPNVTDQHLFPSLKASPTLTSTSSPSASVPVVKA